MRVNSKGSGETAHMHRLAWVFAGRLCDKYQNLMSWLISIKELWILKGHEFKFQPGHIIFVAIDHEIISTAILSPTLIQVGQLLVIGESMCT